MAGGEVLYDSFDNVEMIEVPKLIEQYCSRCLSDMSGNLFVWHNKWCVGGKQKNTLELEYKTLYRAAAS